MKQRYIYTLLVCMLCFGTLVTNINAASQNPPAYRTHTVGMGETVYSIANKYNVSVEEVYKLNPEARNGIKTKQELRIPSPQNNNAGNSYILHSIQPKETLYSVSKHYDVTIEDILAANDGLNANNFRIGIAIRIPRYSNNNTQAATTVQQPTNTDDYTVHIVQSKETLYSISKQYNLSMQEIAEVNPEVQTSGLKKDMVLRIPKKTKGYQTIVNNNNNNIPATRAIGVENVAKIGILLPFLDSQSSMRSRLLEYYEGFLLAVEEMKAKGFSAEIYTFDIRKGNNTKKLESLLGTVEMQNLDLVIGGVTDDEVRILSQFCQNNDIEYAIPFPVKKSSVINGDNSFQINVPQTLIYPKVVDKFCKQFVGYNVIIVSDGIADDKTDFTNELKKGMDKAGITYQTLKIADGLTANLKTALTPARPNMIVPSSSSVGTLGKLFPAINPIQQENPELIINLFGYPDWQAYSQHYLADFFKYGTYFYTSFYPDNNDLKVQQFENNYRRWYNKSLINTYPKYGMMGYDTGLYFMSAQMQKKTTFAEALTSTYVPTLQSAFYFEKIAGENGYINTGVYFIHYKTDQTIEKTNYSR